ncbi:MAG: CoA transferase subunit A [Heliobacteriaceae bacterium]|nr:CoA transferase subunit A [Heliobacteriaceae bacterium]MDD4588516.1 CoA transferase subunit A [Heliobacteriaceae bacterium]
MVSQVNSKIHKISSLQYAEKDFAFWGPTPDEARKIMVNKSHGLRDKRKSLKDAVKEHVRDGINLGIGGFVNTRVPVAIIHEIIRQGARNLTLSFQSNSICPELLAGAMILDPDRLSIKRVELAWWGYEIIGIAPMLRYLTSNKMIEMDDYTNYGMSVRFKAAAMGIPFIPVRDHGGSDMELVNRGKMIECPFTGKNTYVLPACHPDVGIVHTTAADMYGNSRIFGAHCTCPEIAMAATYTIMTTEKIIPTENIRSYPNLTEIPYPVVDTLTEQPFGAYPGASYGHYWFDMEHLKMFRSICEDFRKTGNKAGLQKYYDEYIFGCEDFDEFLEKIGYKNLKNLKAMDGGQSIILT